MSIVEEQEQMNCSVVNTPRAFRNRTMFARGCDAAQRSDWLELWRRFEIPGPFLREMRFGNDLLELGFRLPSIYPRHGLAVEPFKIHTPDDVNVATIDLTEMVYKDERGTTFLREVWKSFVVNVLGGKSFMSEYLFYQIKNGFPSGNIYIRPIKGKLWIDVPLSPELKRQIPAVFIRNEPDFRDLIRQIQEAHRTANDQPVGPIRGLPVPGTPSDPMQIPYNTPVNPGWGHPFGAPYIGDRPVGPLYPGDIIYSDSTLWVARSHGVLNSGTGDAVLQTLVNSINVGTE